MKKTPQNGESAFQLLNHGDLQPADISASIGAKSAQHTKAEPASECGGALAEDPLGVSGSCNLSADAPQSRVPGIPSVVIPLSVTRDDYFSVVSNCRWLAAGFDTVELGVSVAWGSGWSQLTEEFDTEKSRASGTKGIPFGSESCLMLPAGKNENYRWHLQWPEFHLFLGKSPVPEGKTPNAFVSINSRALWEIGLQGAVDLLTARIDELGGMIIGIKPSRCDLAADFLVPGDISLDFLLKHRVPSHVQHSHHMRGDVLETFYQGSPKSPTRLRVYDKGLEIAKGGEKWWFLQVWDIASVEHVWRVEYQVRRKTLKKFSINTLPDLLSQAGGLWKYLTEDWFSLRLDDNGNVTRCSVHPWWQMVQACADKFGEVRILRRVFEGEPADSSWFVSHLAGCVPSFAAREGIEDFETASALLMARVEAHWNSRDFAGEVVKRSIPLGVPGRSGTAESAS